MANPEDHFAYGTPEYWLTRLNRELSVRRRDIARYDDYYEGKHPLLFASEKFRKAFGGLFRDFADNWCGIVIDAVEERLDVDGFRVGEEPEADKDIWRIWQENALDAESQIAHTEALVAGEASVLVWPGKDPATPEITIEHASQMIVAFEAGSRRKRAAALKCWLDDSGYAFTTLYLPTELYKYRSDQKIASGYGMSGIRWVEREIDGEPSVIPNPLGDVPVVPIINRPRLLKPGSSEIRTVMPMQDAVNKELADLIIASEFTSFRQRYVTGMEMPRDPETKQPVEPFKPAADRLWWSEDPDAKFGEFGETNLENYVKVIEMLVQHIASQTRTPPHYFYLSGQFPSGEAIKSAETGLVAKARRKMRHFGDAWEEAMRLALKAAGKKVPDVIETVWGDPEPRTEGEHIDALLKQQSFGVPNEVLWEKAGYTPTEIERMKKIRDEDRAAAPAPVMVPVAVPATSKNGG